MSETNRNKVCVSKRINNYKLYIYADIFEDLKCVLSSLVSDKTSKKLNDTARALHNEVSHLKCDEFTEYYIVERGYNFIDSGK